MMMMNNIGGGGVWSHGQKHRRCTLRFERSTSFLDLPIHLAFFAPSKSCDTFVRAFPLELVNDSSVSLMMNDTRKMCVVCMFDIHNSSLLTT